LLGSLTHFSIYVKQTALLNVRIFIIFKISISCCFQNIISKLKSWYRTITNPYSTWNQVL